MIEEMQLANAGPLGEYITQLTNGLQVGTPVYEIVREYKYIGCPVCGATWPDYVVKPDKIKCPCCNGFKKIAHGKQNTVAELKITNIELYLDITEHDINTGIEGIYVDDNCSILFDSDIHYLSREEAERACAEANEQDENDKKG